MTFYQKNCVLLLIGLTLMMSCVKDSDTVVDIKDNLPEVKEKIFSTFNGLILTTDNELIEGANVHIGGESGISDENGFFTISGFFNPDGTNLLVSMNGYFDASGLLIPYADVPVTTTVKLIEKNNPLNVETDKVAIYETDVASVTFAENSYVLNNIKYEGNVDIFGTSIGIDNPEYSLYSPGSLETIKDSELKILFPYGRVNIEIYSESGEQLDIDSPAEIKFDIADEFVQIAPDEIPMWYLDKDTGLWIKDGLALKSGNKYIGEVNHFTDWCVAGDFDIYELSGVVTRNGETYANANMGVSLFSYRVTFKSASDGSYRIPLFEFEGTRILDVSDECGVPLFEQDISQLSSDITQDIDITKTANSFVVSGNIYCDDPDTNVEGGYVLVNFDNNQFSEVVSSDASGGFRFFYEDCNNKNVTIRAYDPVESKQSRQFSVSGDTDNLAIDVCAEEITGSIRIEIDGEEPYVIPGCTVDISDFDGLPGFVYIFRSRDNFTSLPNVTGEYADYEVTVNVSVPGQIQLPYGPISSPNQLVNGFSENAPFYYDIVPAGVTVISENDEVVIIKTNDMFPVSKWVGDVRTELQGQIILEGIKI